MSECKRPPFNVLQRLNDRYMNDPTMSMDHIAICLGVAPCTVRAWFIRHSLPIKPPGQAWKGKPCPNRGKRLGPYKRRVVSEPQQDSVIVENAA